jgi:aldehyde:ferredoxin oxidoreductase
MITLNEGPYKGYYGEEPEYECYATFGPVIGNTDATAVVYLSNELDRLGMDVNEIGWTMGLAIECYEKGVITKDDTDGIELTWGNIKAVDQMMRKIAAREGFGDILAEGAMRAAQRIGGDAPRFAVHTMKGNTPRGHDHRNRWAMLFDTCISQMSSDEGYAVARPSDFGWDIKPTLGTNFDAEDTLEWNIRCKGGHQFEDCLGTCRFTTRTDIKALSEALSAVTGWEFSKEEAMQVGRRIVTLLRAFNMRHGHIAEMDAPSPRYAETPKDGPSKGKDIKATWGDMRRRYYEAMGWDGKTGKPLPETLKQLGLEEIVGRI